MHISCIHLTNKKKHVIYCLSNIAPTIFMSITITFPSALIYWLTCPNTNVSKNICTYPNDDSFDLSTHNDLQRLNYIKDLPSPLHIMVDDSAHRHKGSSFVCHMKLKGIPADSFVHLSDSIRIIRPELCFLLAAKHLPIPDLSLLATDMCGTYAICKNAQYEQIKRAPVTSIKSIENYLKKTKNVSGVKSARTALQYAFDNSNSPMESKCAVVGCLPYYYGGYALPRPCLNYLIMLSSDGQLLLRRESCICDMVWPELHCIAEYDSDLVHFSKNQVKYDKKRNNALQQSGYKMLNVTTDYFRNFHTVDDLYQIIRNMLGLRFYKQPFIKYSEKRNHVVGRFFLTTNGMDWLRWAAKIGAST